MLTSFGNAAQAARERAGLTQEGAAELLHVSARSLSDYERCQTLPADDVVLKMMQRYQAPWIGYIYLRQSTVGQALLPELTSRDLSASILDLQVELSHNNSIQMQLAEVGRDNRIDEREQAQWQRFACEMKELMGSLFSVLMAPVSPQIEKSRPMRAVK